MRALVLALATTVACMNVTYVNPQVPPGGGVIETTGHFFIFGLAGHETIPAYQMCPHGVAAMHSDFGVADVLLTFFTFGIYAPRTYYIECGR